jgi:hypothetical protein
MISRKGTEEMTEIGIKYLYPEVWGGDAELTDEIIADVIKRTEGMLTEACLLGDNIGTINGHFWVERDGKVVDTTINTKGFKEQECNRTRIAMTFGMTMGVNAKKLCEGLKNPEYVYVEAPPITQKIMIASIMTPYIKVFNGNVDFALECLSTITYRPKFGCCNMNALMEQMNNGGEIKFGSLGYKVFGVTDWCYGCDTYKTIKEFRDYNSPKEEEIQKMEFIRNMILTCDPDKKQLAKFDKDFAEMIAGM